MAIKKSRIKIGGMMCSFCSQTIEKALKRTTGIVSVNVSLAHGEALIEHDPDIIRLEGIKKLLHNLGYTAKEPSEVRDLEEEERLLKTEFRVTGKYEHMDRALEIFNKEMESLWDKKAGVYATSKGASRYEYTPFDVGSVIASLNSVLWFALPSYEEPQSKGPQLAARRYVSFFENAVVLSGLQQSSGLYLVEPLYLKREPLNHFVHPALPEQTKAGGRYGIAPVYAGKVAFENGRWKVVDRNFRTRDAMFLSVMSVILNRHSADSFVPVEKILHRLIYENYQNAPNSVR